MCTWFDTAGPSTATSALPCATSAVLHGMGDKCARGAIFRDVVLEGVSIVTVPKIAGWCSSWTMEEVTPMGNLQIMRDIIESDTRCGLATRDVVQHGRLVNMLHSLPLRRYSHWPNSKSAASPVMATPATPGRSKPLPIFRAKKTLCLLVMLYLHDLLVESIYYINI